MIEKNNYNKDIKIKNNQQNNDQYKKFNETNERIFWKVIRNIVLFCKIIGFLDSRSILGDCDGKGEVFRETFIPHKIISSIEWMVQKRQFSLFKDKIVWSPSTININKCSINYLMQRYSKIVQVKEITLLLLQHRFNDMIQNGVVKLAIKNNNIELLEILFSNQYNQKICPKYSRYAINYSSPLTLRFLLEISTYEEQQNYDLFDNQVKLNALRLAIANKKHQKSMIKFLSENQNLINIEFPYNDDDENMATVYISELNRVRSVSSQNRIVNIGDAIKFGDIGNDIPNLKKTLLTISLRNPLFFIDYIEDYGSTITHETFVDLYEQCFSNYNEHILNYLLTHEKFRNYIIERFKDDGDEYTTDVWLMSDDIKNVKKISESFIKTLISFSPLRNLLWERKIINYLYFKSTRKVFNRVVKSTLQSGHWLGKNLPKSYHPLLRKLCIREPEDQFQPIIITNKTEIDWFNDNFIPLKRTVFHKVKKKK